MKLEVYSRKFSIKWPQHIEMNLKPSSDSDAELFFPEELTLKMVSKNVKPFRAKNTDVFMILNAYRTNKFMSVVLGEE